MKKLSEEIRHELRFIDLSLFAPIQITVSNLHYNVKTNMAAIANKAFSQNIGYRILYFFHIDGN